MFAKFHAKNVRASPRFKISNLKSFRGLRPQTPGPRRSSRPAALFGLQRSALTGAFLAPTTPGATTTTHHYSAAICVCPGVHSLYGSPSLPLPPRLRPPPCCGAVRLARPLPIGAMPMHVASALEPRAQLKIGREKATIPSSCATPCTIRSDDAANRQPAARCGPLGSFSPRSTPIPHPTNAGCG